MKIVSAILTLGLTTLGVTRSAAATPACRADPFLDELASDGDDFRLVSILKEREIALRGTPDGFTCARRLLGAYLRFKEFDTSQTWMVRIAASYPDQLGAAELPRLEAELALLVGNPTEVRRNLEHVPDDPRKLELLAFAAAFDVPPRAPSALCASQPCAQLRLLEVERNYTRSAALAVALGIVPGMGQVYAGRTLSGIGSFVLNSFVIGVAAWGYARHEYAFAVMDTAAATGIYLGSIYAGYEATIRANEHQATAMRERIRAIPLDLDVVRLGL